MGRLIVIVVLAVVVVAVVVAVVVVVEVVVVVVVVVVVAVVVVVVVVVVMSHFSWQAQHVVKFGMIAGARNVVIFNRICSWRVRKVALAARRVQFCVFRVGSCSERSRIGRALEMTFQLFSVHFCLILGAHFAWQAQYLVRLQRDACCSAHCK